MPRDVLLVLVLVAVLLNLSLLVAAGIGWWRGTREPARPRQTPRPQPGQDATIPPLPYQALARRPRPAPWSPAGAREIPGYTQRERWRSIPTPIPPADPNAGPPTAPNRPAAATMTAPAERSLDESRSTVPETRSGAADGSGEPDQPGSRQEAGNRRGRRFVLPPDDEDRGRTERAIEAFLGEPAPSGSTSTHRPRRRARRHRPPGQAPAPVVLVAALGGFDELRHTLGREGAGRFAEAYGEALRATLRSGDHVTDLGQGRLRLVVHADEEGARALMDRARAVCQPWLRLSPVPLALRVRPMPVAPAPAALAADGRTNGSTPVAEARSSTQPNGEARRRLAAG